MSRRVHRRLRRLFAVRAAVDHQREVVARLQGNCGGWLVIWSPWRRTFTGFACFTAEPVIVDEAVESVFLARIEQVEQAHGRR
jgi:hypothetical protein